MKQKIFIGLVVFFIGLISFSGLNVKQAQGQSGSGICEKKYGETPEDSVNCVTNISLYREYYKPWKKAGYKSAIVEDAIGPWRWVFLNCPCGTQNTYIDGVKILEYLIKKAASPEDKEAYIDTLMMLYDQRIKYFGKEGSVLGRKGIDLYKYRTKAYDEAYAIFKRSVELQGNKSLGPVLIYYFRTTVKMANTGKVDSAVIIETYDRLSNIIDYNLEKTTKRESWENIKGNIDMTVEPYLQCPDLISIYTKKFEENPDDVELLKKITKLLDKRKCNDSELFFKTSVKLYEVEPSADAAFMIGKMYINSKDYAEAIKYLKEAETMEDPEALADAYYYMAFCYQMLNNYPQSRAMARKAIAQKSDMGNAYLLIGDLYAASSDDCGADDVMKKAVYWIAVDYYYKAKKVDPEVAASANERIAAYSKYFPTKEEVFFRDLNDGDPYDIECWINESTTVRAAKQ